MYCRKQEAREGQFGSLIYTSLASRTNAKKGNENGYGTTEDREGRTQAALKCSETEVLAILWCPIYQSLSELSTSGLGVRRGPAPELKVDHRTLD